MADDKLKLLYLMQLLLEETDPKHPLNATQLCERMDARYGLKYARKTVYADSTINCDNLQNRRRNTHEHTNFRDEEKF